jgi:shikimate kinase
MPKPLPPNCLILIGNRGCGKTTLGKAIAREKGWAFVDMDDVVREEILM